MRVCVAPILAAAFQLGGGLASAEQAQSPPRIAQAEQGEVSTATEAASAPGDEAHTAELQSSAAAAPSEMQEAMSLQDDKSEKAESSEQTTPRDEGGSEAESARAARSADVEASASTETDASVEQIEDPKDRDRLIFRLDNLVGAQYGPLALVYRLDGYIRKNLFPDSDDILFKDAHVSGGLSATLTPTTFSWGPSVTIAPLTILKLNLNISHVTMGFLGNKYGFMDFTNAGQFSDFSYAYRNEHGDTMGSFKADLLAFTASPTLMFKVGKFVGVYTGTYTYYQQFNFSGLYYNYFADMVLSPTSFYLGNSLLLAYMLADMKADNYGLLLGLSTKFNAALASNDDIEPAARLLVGLMGMWNISRDWFGVIREPAALVQLHYMPIDPIADDAVGLVGEPRVINVLVGMRFSFYN